MRIDPVKQQYSVVMDLSLIATLLLTILVLRFTKITIVNDDTLRIKTVIEFTKVDLTKAKYLPPPRRPVVPVASDQETMLGDETIDDTEIDLDEIPPPPPPPYKKEKSDDQNAFVAYDTPPQLKGGLEFIRKYQKYPEAAKAAGIEGVAMVRAIIDAKGDVVKAEILKEDGNVGFGQAAMDVVAKCKFEPAKFKGKAVKVAITLPITFKK